MSEKIVKTIRVQLTDVQLQKAERIRMSIVGVDPSSEPSLANIITWFIDSGKNSMSSFETRKSAKKYKNEVKALTFLLQKAKNKKRKKKLQIKTQKQ